MSNTPPRSAGDGWDQRYSQHPWPTDPDERLAALTAELPAGSAIDLGCGTGRNALWLAHHGWRVTGVDGSRVGLSQAQATAQADGVRLETVVAELTSYVPTPRSYDLVVVANIHLASDERDLFYARAREAVAPGGYLYISGHDVASLGRSGPPEVDRLFTLDMVSAFGGDLSIDVLERDEWLEPGDPTPVADVVLWARRPRNEVPA